MKQRLWKPSAMLAAIVLVVSMLLGSGGIAPVSAQQPQQGGDIQRVTKIATPAVISPNQTSRIDLNMTAEPCGGVVAGQANVALVIDASSSMAGTRINRAKQAASSFVDLMQDQDLLTVVRFQSGADATALLPIVGSRENFKAAINALEAGGQTNMSAGINLANEQLQGAPGNRTMILLSDGLPNRGGGENGARTAADRAKANGITIYTIGYGTDAPNDFLRDSIASRSTTHYEVADGGDLNEIYTQISGQIDRTSPVGTNATVVERFDNTWFNVTSASNGGVVDQAAGTITWNLGTLNNEVTLSYVVSPKFNNTQYFASRSTSYSYTRGDACSSPNQSTTFDSGEGALVTVNDAPPPVQLPETGEDAPPVRLPEQP